MITLKRNMMMARIGIFAITILLLTSCEKFRGFDNLEITEDSFTGTTSLTESTGVVNGTFNGMTDSGAFGFIWENPTKGAVLDVEVFGSKGNVSFILEDSRGHEVLNATTAGESNVFFIEGKKGKWKLRVVFFEFEGNGNFSLSPVQ
jgi:hypothetical protein